MQKHRNSMAAPKPSLKPGTDWRAIWAIGICGGLAFGC
ncbi:UNVERIFIED_CONTAM: hypothetical protein GTU68_048084 [Idotea baltica]|nr:hypothetical protein [Idotea baltica]